ncbi:melanoma-associated antigen B17-like [Neomonachus schauinslandi]|uniref:Melanoma-associated antigen B17-like n=1 Tax=Neomonachus schauinslandi TaxID=29088 RepID=A0A2Y9G6E1_NEOSC|nr:melanoma-associated antigen B17-like [Neomonachus schauinslandi]XP_021533344.1 melanoma-associated antigen B17-like [Neomonachus schauinslandi]XP_044767556.1 melanoma-associated antigen B17-like [Neomonachus schauinslandi]
MPRGQKSKVRAREKRHQGRGEAQSLGGAPAAAAAAAAAEEPPRSPPPGVGAMPPGSPEAGPPPQPQGAPAPGSPGADPPGPPRDQGAQNAEAAAAPAPRAARKDPLTRKASVLVQFLLEKHGTGEPITRAALLKMVSRKYREHFPEIFRLTSERMELVFGLELREVDTRSQSYTLVSKLSLPSDGNKGLPKTGLLMALLGVIFMKGNRATEEEVWEFLNVLGVQEGRRHLIFGEPRKLITQDLVHQGYLEYRAVPASDPPRHEFLWGPRARAETSKMQVLQVLAKINDTVPSCFPELYEEALQEQKERAAARGWRRV